MEKWTSEILKIQHTPNCQACTWRSGTRSSLRFPMSSPIELIAIKDIAVIPYLVITTFWILFSKSLNIVVLFLIVV
jgi:hypothetical protein